MTHLALLLLLAFADDPWTKLREMKAGTDLRIYKHGYKQPIAAKLHSATADRLRIVLGESQVTIPKAEIDQIEQPPGKAVYRRTAVPKP